MNEKRNPKKLTLTVRSVDSLETRASPDTACPEAMGLRVTQCCAGSQAMFAGKLTAVAFF